VGTVFCLGFISHGLNTLFTFSINYLTFCMISFTNYNGMPSGGARVLDKTGGGGKHFSVGRQTSHVVQIGFFLLEKK